MMIQALKEDPMSSPKKIDKKSGKTILFLRQNFLLKNVPKKSVNPNYY